jgi:hypothetical protein
MPILPLFLPILIIAVLLADIFFFVSGIVSFLYGAPFVMLAKDKVKKALRQCGLSEEDVFCDLGCGDGRTLLIAAEEFKVKKAVGWEIASFPFFLAKMAIGRSKARDRIEIYSRDLFAADISKATFIYVYLASRMADRVADKIAKEALDGTKVVCMAFPIDTSKHRQLELVRREKADGMIAYLYQRSGW